MGKLLNCQNIVLNILLFFENIKSIFYNYLKDLFEKVLGKLWFFLLIYYYFFNKLLL